jgi:hypothetical protein
VKVYVAGSSGERTLVSSFMRRLEAAGHTITKDWTEAVEAKALAGRVDSDLSDEERAMHAQADLDGIDAADVVWLLAPASGSTGAWVELGYAFGLLTCTVVSGAHRRTIFGALANQCFDDHESAFRWILEQREAGASER